MRRTLAKRSGQWHPIRPGSILRSDTDPDKNGQGQEDARHDARHDARDQQLGDGCLGRDAVNDHGNARRDEDVEDGPDPDRARGQFLGIAVAAHFRVGDGRHDGGPCNARPAHGPEDPAGENRRDPEAAPYEGQPVCRGREKVFGKTAGCGKVGHEDEHGDRGQRIVGDRGERRCPQDHKDHFQIAGDQIDAQDAGAGQRKRDRDTQKKSDDHCNKRQSEHFPSSLGQLSFPRVSL